MHSKKKLLLFNIVFAALFFFIKLEVPAFSITSCKSCKFVTASIFSKNSLNIVKKMKWDIGGKLLKK